MTIALARPVLAVPRVALPSLFSTPRLVPLLAEPRRYATAPQTSSREASAGRRARVEETTPHLRITRRGRAVLTLLAAVPLSAGAVMLVSVASTPASSASVSDSSAAGEASDPSLSSTSALAGAASEGSDYVQIASGDSLWSVAEVIAPDADPREVIDDLVRTNALSSLDVYPGQQLEIPTRY